MHISLASLSLQCDFSKLPRSLFLSASSRLRCKSSPLRHRFNYISPCVIVSKIRPQPLKTPREQPSTFSAVKLSSKRKPALKRRTGRERASKILHFPFWDFYIFRGQQSVFAAFIRNSPHPLGGIAQRTRKQPDTRKRGKTVHFRKRGKGIYPLTDTAERNCPA